MESSIFDTNLIHAHSKYIECETMNYKEQYDLIVLFKSKTTAELHDMLMIAFDWAERKLGEIQFTKDRPIRETYEEFQRDVAPTIQNIYRLQSILAVREQNESKRIIYEKNAIEMMSGCVIQNEYNNIMNRYYSERVKEIKDITEIAHHNGDSNVARQYVREKIEMEENNERQFLNNVLLKHLLDLTICRANIDKNNNSSDMY